MSWGVFKKESNEEYHLRSEYSSSDIKWMLESPFHFKANVIDKLLKPKVSNDAFDLGTCAHECFMEQDTSNYVSLPQGIDRRTKDGKARYEAFIERNKGKRIVTHEQSETVKKMFDVIASNSYASGFLNGSTIEQGAWYRDPRTNLLCKFRPDILNVERGFIADYKTCFSASPHEFSKAVARYYYHLSATHYLVGSNLMYDGAIKNYYFIAQEKTYPFAVAIYKMDSTDIFRSYELRNSLMSKIKLRLEIGSWPDWSGEEQTLHIPGYGFES